MTSLSQILIKAQKNVFRTNIGNNATNFKGNGYDFEELREYSSGDDIRHIDWIISSKLAKPYVKLFTQERELNLIIAPIMSASLYFGTQKLKIESLSEVCALLSYNSIRQNDPFQSYICEESVQICTPRSKQTASVHNFISKLHSFELIGQKISYPKIVQGIYESIISSSMIFFIGDFLIQKISILKP